MGRAAEAHGQLDLFCREPAPMVRFVLPTMATIAGHVGTAAGWQRLTLSQVLTKWEDVYEAVVAALQAAIEEALAQASNPEYGRAERGAYKQEHARLVDAQRQLRGAAENAYCENLLSIIEQAKRHLRAAGLDEDAVEDSHEFLNEVFVRPIASDLGKRIPLLMRDIAAEYQRLEQGAGANEAS